MPSDKTLNPNASPYLRTPTPHFYVHVSPYPHHNFLPPVVHTYRLHLQPSQPKSFSKSGTRPPSSTRRINFSLTPVPCGPRIPKSRLVRFCKSHAYQMQWRPKLPDNKPSESERKRWKNSSKEYHEVLPLNANTTSLMIKNVPNKYTRKLLINLLDAHCELENKKTINDGSDKGSISAYDFLYLPIDFKRRLNAGFAFVNFTTPEAALRFREAFEGKSWNPFGRSKVAEISGAKIQGKEALINNCKGMNFTNGSEEDMPVFFAPARDGSGRIPSKMFTVGKCFC